MLLYVNFVLRTTNFFLVHNVGKGMVREGSFPFVFFVPMQIPQKEDVNIANNIDNNKPVTNCEQL